MWTVCAFLLILTLRDHRQKLWLAFGVAAGIGFLDKYSMAFWGVGLVLGLLFTARREFRSRWIMVVGGRSGTADRAAESRMGAAAPLGNAASAASGARFQPAAVFLL